MPYIICPVLGDIPTPVFMRDFEMWDRKVVKGTGVGRFFGALGVRMGRRRVRRRRRGVNLKIT